MCSFPVFSTGPISPAVDEMGRGEALLAGIVPGSFDLPQPIVFEVEKNLFPMPLLQRNPRLRSLKSIGQTAFDGWQSGVSSRRS